MVSGRWRGEREGGAYIVVVIFFTITPRLVFGTDGRWTGEIIRAGCGGRERVGVDASYICRWCCVLIYICRDIYLARTADDNITRWDKIRGGKAFKESTERRGRNIGPDLDGMSVVICV